MNKLIPQLALATLLTGSATFSATACDRAATQRYPSTHQNRTVHYVVVRRAVQTPEREVVDAGVSYRLTGESFGLSIGDVVLQIGDAQIQCDVQTWAHHEVTFGVPPLKMTREVMAELKIISPRGRILLSKDVRVRGIVSPRIESVLEPITHGTTIIDQVPLIEPFPSIEQAAPVAPAPLAQPPNSGASNFDMNDGFDSL
ncbi:MAG: hypothetical protein WBD20_01240 [Pirellulaceae bacterium]